MRKIDLTQNALFEDARKPAAGIEEPLVEPELMLPVEEEFEATESNVVEGVELAKTKPFEAVFPEELTQFMTALNFTSSGEEVFQLLVDLGKRYGFKMVAYEYCHNVESEDAHIFTRSNLPKAMTMMERWTRNPKRVSYGRRHCTHKWTPGVSGSAFVEMFEDYPDYQRKLKFAQTLPGVRSGIGIPLRSPDPKARAGISFSGKMSREECLSFVKEHGTVLTTIAWAAHIRMMQHISQAKAEEAEFTERQVEYIDLVAEGLLDKQIAHHMGISHSGVRKHQSAVCRKLGIRRRGEIAAAAQRCGLLGEPELDLTTGPGGAWDNRVFRGRAKRL